MMTNRLDEKKEQEELMKEVYSDKAGNILKKWVIGLLIFNFISYGLSACFGFSDFGVFFEMVTLLFVILAIHAINDNYLEKAKIYVVIAMIPIGWLLIYDYIDLFSHFTQIIEDLVRYYSNLGFFFYVYVFNFVDVSLLLLLLLLFKSYKSLGKSINPEEYKKSSNWFYDQK